MLRLSKVQYKNDSQTKIIRQLYSSTTCLVNTTKSTAPGGQKRQLSPRNRIFPRLLYVNPKRFTDYVKDRR